MKAKIAHLFRRTACRFCAQWCKPKVMIGGACPTCVRENLDWLNDLGVRLAVPQGFRWQEVHDA